MPFPLTHLVGAYLLSAGFHTKMKKRHWLIFLIGAVLPDIDFLFYEVLQFPLHRTLTHSILFIALTSVLFWALLRVTKNDVRLSGYLALGMLIHIGLDMMIYPGVQLFWPSSIWIGIQGVVTTINTAIVASPHVTLGKVVIDLAVGVLWVLWKIGKKKEYHLHSL
jgi:membrane-bound metal-dependent hydrolase YbcI (DUF457 family)